jgi:hypothetical protein
MSIFSGIWIPLVTPRLQTDVSITTRCEVSSGLISKRRSRGSLRWEQRANRRRSITLSKNRFSRLSSTPRRIFRS